MTTRRTNQTTQTAISYFRRAAKKGVNSTEFWGKVRRIQKDNSPEEVEAAAHKVWREYKSGGHQCSKCNGTGIYKWVSIAGPQEGTCYHCLGKGFMSPKDEGRTWGYYNGDWKRNPQRGKQKGE